MALVMLRPNTKAKRVFLNIVKNSKGVEKRQEKNQATCATALDQAKVGEGCCLGEEESNSPALKNSFASMPYKSRNNAGVRLAEGPSYTTWPWFKAMMRGQ
jgi:hypothetical protein